MSELRPSRDLLDHKFNGYKLSLASVPVYKLELSGVDTVEPSEDQYSFLHQREFSLHNHLHSDPWCPQNVYFIDDFWKVKRININEITGRPDGMSNVFEIPKLYQRSGGEFNLSLLFPSEDLVVVGDGFKSLHLIKARSRNDASSTEWKLLHSEAFFEDPRPFHIMDSIYSAENHQLHCILLHVEPKDQTEFEIDKKENKNTSKYETVLQWITFKSDETCEHWTMERNEELCGSGKVEYAAIESTGKAIYLASQNKFKFSKLEQNKDEISVAQENGDKVDYHWQQSFDDITLFFDRVTSTEGVSVTVNQKSVVIKYCDKMLLCGTLSRNVSSELTTWTLNESRLEIVLQKSESGAMWQKLMVEPKSNNEKIFVGKEIIDPEMVEDISSRLSHFTSESAENGSGIINDWQMEECDAFEDESTILFRYVHDSPEPTHKIHVGGNQWLFILRTGGGCPPSMCIRADVDGCIWKPAPPDDTSWPVTHIGTFFAFGYILASKVNRKFTVAPPDLSYVSVIDNTGHVIIYRQGVAVVGELRNRKTHQHVQSIATQSMVNLQTKETILGAVATSPYLFILTNNHLHLIHIV